MLCFYLIMSGCHTLSCAVCSVLHSYTVLNAVHWSKRNKASYSGITRCDHTLSREYCKIINVKQPAIPVSDTVR